MAQKSPLDRLQSLNAEAKEIKQKLSGEETEQYAALLNNIGNLYNGSANYDQAELLFVESRDIKARLLGKEDPEAVNDEAHVPKQACNEIIPIDPV
jgi:hypothetical protein